MSRYESNPFVRYELDPSASLAELTERLRELAEDASEQERAELRAAWEMLSRSPARRLELVLEAGPTPPRIAGPSTRTSVPWPEPSLADVLAPPPLAPLLAPESDAERSLRAMDLSFLVRDDESTVTGELRRTE